jgi:hypothetical protein
MHLSNDLEAGKIMLPIDLNENVRKKLAKVSFWGDF